MSSQRELPSQIQALDRETLTGPVRRMLQSDTLDVLDWQVRPLGGGFGNPVSLGLYGTTGSGQDRGGGGGSGIAGPGWPRGGGRGWDRCGRRGGWGSSRRGSRPGADRRRRVALARGRAPQICTKERLGRRAL
jgi:hypothetical protein